MRLRSELEGRVFFNEHPVYKNKIQNFKNNSK